MLAAQRFAAAHFKAGSFEITEAHFNTAKAAKHPSWTSTTDDLLGMSLDQISAKRGPTRTGGGKGTKRQGRCGGVAAAADVADVVVSRAREERSARAASGAPTGVATPHPTVLLAARPATTQALFTKVTLCIIWHFVLVSLICDRYR